jgi:hypothetical protein
MHSGPPLSAQIGVWRCHMARGRVAQVFGWKQTRPLVLMREFEARIATHMGWAGFCQAVQAQMTALLVTKANSVVGAPCADRPHSKSRVTEAICCFSMSHA